MFNFNFQEPFGFALIDWGITFSLIIGSIIGAKLIYWVLSKIARKLTSKTKSKLDDILLDMLEEPIAYLIGITGIWKSIYYIEISESTGNSYDKIYYLILVGLLAWALTRTLDALVEVYLIPLVEKSKSELDDQLLPILIKTIKSAVWTICIIIGLDNAGYDVGAVIAGLGIGGLAFALAAQDSVKNLFGGITIFTDKPFQIKDRIKISGFDGSVEEIGIRSTRIRTLDGRRVTIPNSKFSESAIENVTSEPNRKVVLNLGLTYDTDQVGIQKGIKILDEIVSSHSSTEDKVITGFNAFNDSSLNLILVYYIRPGEDILATQTTINLKILEQFTLNQLEFAFPTQTLYNIESK
jgi:MscS family membrane protein